MGIDALKDFLGQLLLGHIRKEYPHLVREIENLAEKTEKDLEACGPPRQTAAEQRRYLTRVATTYQKQVSDSLIGLYNTDLSSKHPLKLRLNIRTLNEEFADDFKHNGHRRVFKAVDGGIDKDFSRYSTVAAKDEEDIYEWIREVYRDSRGVELPGTVNPAVLEHIFRQQSIPWQDISERYLSRAKDAVKSYLDHIFPEIVGDQDISSKLVAFIQPKMTESMSKADEGLKNVLCDEREGVLQTVNHYMSENIAAIREERVMARLKAATQLDRYNQPITFALVSRVVHLSNEDHTVYDIHDILKAYYKVAGKRFMDNIVIQVVERYILGGRGPLKLFTPELVADLSDEDLEFIAGESYGTSATRTELKSKLERLRKSLEVASGIPR